MLQEAFEFLLGWLPLPLYWLCMGVVAIFSIIVVLRLIKLILDVIPFL